MADEKKAQAQTDAEENAEERGKEEVPKEEKAEEPKEEKKKEEPKEEPEEMSPELEELAKKYEGLVSEIEKLSVIELAEVVKVLEKKFGVSAAAPVAAGASGGDEAGEKDAFNIMLQSAGDLKINVIKVVREITGLGLKESKELVEGAPKVIKEGVKKEEADEFKKKLEEAGATVELQ